MGRETGPGCGQVRETLFTKKMSQWHDLTYLTSTSFRSQVLCRPDRTVPENRFSFINSENVRVSVCFQQNLHLLRDTGSMLVQNNSRQCYWRWHSRYELSSLPLESSLRDSPIPDRRGWFVKVLTWRALEKPGEDLERGGGVVSTCLVTCRTGSWMWGEKKCEIAEERKSSLFSSGTRTIVWVKELASFVVVVAFVPFQG